MSRGVLTAANADFWPILRNHVRSCREQGVDVAVVNHGLTTQQQAAIVSMGGTVMPHPPSAVFAISPEKIHSKQNLGRKYVAAWYKPLLIKESPFDETLWIDADAIPIRGLDNMFELLEDGPFISHDWWIGPWKNIYGVAVERILGSIPNAFYSSTWINAGVLGVRRGDAVICDWIENCRKVISDDFALAKSPCRDQTALAISLSENPGLMRIIPDWRINMPVNGLLCNEGAKRKKYRFNEDSILTTLREDHPLAWVIHWLGPNKPWWGHNKPMWRRK